MNSPNPRTVYDVPVRGKRVLVRNDFNVPLDTAGNITDMTRISASLLTLEYLLAQGARVICSSHLGRPKGILKPGLSLQPVARQLSKLLNREVKFVGETVGKKVDKVKEALEPGEIMLLENLRYSAEEVENRDGFARKLARDIDVYVNDAFGACHRAHASIDRITRFVPQAVAGLLLKEEIEALSQALENPPAEYVVILGGVKVSDKIPVIRNLMSRARDILIGGAMAYTFLKARGIEVGQSRVEEEFFPLCRDLLDQSGRGSARIRLPLDHVAAQKIEPDITVRQVGEDETIPENMMGLDIGIRTADLYSQIISRAKMILWNGPVGVFEIDTFSGGTMEIARAVAETDAVTIIGGGDTAAAVQKAGVKQKMTHVSTGGGASLEFLAGKPLPGITALLSQED